MFSDTGTDRGFTVTWTTRLAEPTDDNDADNGR